MLIVYTPGIDADLLLLNWYLDLGRGPDFEATFSAEFAPCASFMAGMQKCLLVYEADERGIWFAAWFDRVMSAGAFGLWVREDKRHSHFDTPGNDVLRAIIEAIAFGLERFPVLLFVSRNANVVGQGQRLGFTIMGDIPWLFDGDTATLAWVDSEHFRKAIEPYRGLFAEGNGANG